MKTTTILALAASLGEVAASFRGAKPFSCPDNTIEQCDVQQQRGFDWEDLADGAFNNYGGFEFNGFECKSDKLGKRDALTGRNFGRKAAFGRADRRGGSSFGCGKGGQVNKFSIIQFDISVQIDIDLEFVYDMADGSKCKHRSKCSKDGTTVKNSQCGGAKNVTVVYPDQDGKTEDSCEYGIHHISFACGDPTSTTLVATETPTLDSTTPPTPPSVTVETSATEPVETETTETAEVTEATETAATETAATETAATESTEVTEATETATTETTETEATEVSTEFVETNTVETTTEVTSTYVTSFLSTSTVFETSVVTVTGCGTTAAVSCPAGSLNATVVVVTETIAVSTTLCPVTETQTTTLIEVTTAIQTSTVVVATDTTTSNPVDTSLNSPVEPTSTTTDDGITTETVVEPNLPVETLPCPAVVPACLNTWLFIVNCDSNTDHTCYCPSSIFVSNIFTCIYAHGETDIIISQAVLFFQGICADHAVENPAIITDAETVTEVITVTADIPAATVTATEAYTTVEVVKTTVMPVEENGTTVEGAVTTVIVSTEMTVPQVSFATQTAVATSGGVVATEEEVVLVPATTAIAITEGNSPVGGTQSFVTLVPTGTNGLPATTTGEFVFFTGAAVPRNGAAFGAIALGVAGAFVGF